MICLFWICLLYCVFRLIVVILDLGMVWLVFCDWVGVVVVEWFLIGVGLFSLMVEL